MDIDITSMQYRLDLACIETIYGDGNLRFSEAKLKFKGIVIKRPFYNSCVDIVKKEFSVDI